MSVIVRPGAWRDCLSYGGSWSHSLRVAPVSQRAVGWLHQVSGFSGLRLVRRAQ